MCDHTDLLGAAAYRQIDGMLSTFESQYKTQCGSSMRGLRVGVAITDTAKPYAKIGEYADALYRHWGLGQPCDNGILVALAISDRQSTIVSGKVRLPSRAGFCIGCVRVGGHCVVGRCGTARSCRRRKGCCRRAWHRRSSPMLH